MSLCSEALGCLQALPDTGSSSQLMPVAQLTSHPQTDWATLAPSILHTYRTAYRLATPSSYTFPHADLIYNSSRTALRAPSAVLARRRLRDLKHQRRKAA